MFPGCLAHHVVPCTPVQQCPCTAPFLSQDCLTQISKPRIVEVTRLLNQRIGIDLNRNMQIHCWQSGWGPDRSATSAGRKGGGGGRSTGRRQRHEDWQARKGEAAGQRGDRETAGGDAGHRCNSCSAVSTSAIVSCVGRCCVAGSSRVRFKAVSCSACASHGRCVSHGARPPQRLQRASMRCSRHTTHHALVPACIAQPRLALQPRRARRQ